MSFSGAGGVPGSLKKIPPERGSFPLDHYGECKEVMQRYLACLKANKTEQQKCRPLAKEYLQCRMDRELFGKDDMKNLGFKDETEETKTPSQPNDTNTQEQQQKNDDHKSNETSS
ncbi:copper chaperone [Schizosaccharomyces japonicus yFS275]|uniref:Cytochrome c oxidase assembly protein COX19 n=1 Tax=Schizosaccharomyces japonicus (strain yFS275 / FY16936) TaxID=402676 RepID=B6JZF8_SCHJY|nr:copper chaperone [Schizosaccharomyces japonicus yFS275]EEB06926.2 copper chaperone [Schizosaccharomyces japonicus yFS275]